jgi:predicted nucleotidyltransferase/HEPN domain-containing protein
MKSTLEHLPEQKQREIARIVEIIHEEFEEALKEATAKFKTRGRIQKIILFGSFARGTWVDEPHTKKGYRSDYDILAIVNDRKLAEPQYWYKATDRLIHDKDISVPVGLIVHSAREVNNFLHDGQYFFSDIRRDGIVLYELDDRPLAEPKPLSPADVYRVAKEHYEDRLPHARVFLKTAKFCIEENDLKEAAFLLHQAIEQAYAACLLVLTNYSPSSHNLKFLRGLAEEQARTLADVWPRDQQRHLAWFNILNSAYVKARYSKQFEITDEALTWLSERTSVLIHEVDTICTHHLQRLEHAIEDDGH